MEGRTKLSGALSETPGGFDAETARIDDEILQQDLSRVSW